MRPAVSMTMALAPPDQLIGRRHLRQTIPVSDMTIWRWERDGVFPRHISINGRNYWRRSDVDAWLAGQPATVLAQTPDYQAENPSSSDDDERRPMK